MKPVNMLVLLGRLEQGICTAERALGRESVVFPAPGPESLPLTPQTSFPPQADPDDASNPRLRLLTPPAARRAS